MEQSQFGECRLTPSLPSPQRRTISVSTRGGTHSPLRRHSACRIADHSTGISHCQRAQWRRLKRRQWSEQQEKGKTGEGEKKMSNALSMFFWAGNLSNLAFPLSSPSLSLSLPLCSLLRRHFATGAEFVGLICSARAVAPMWVSATTTTIREQ